MAPEVDPPAEPSLYSFAYTTPSAGAAVLFVVAGGGELPDGAFEPKDIVRCNDTSPDAMAAKADFVVGLMEARLRGLGASWSQVGATNIYAVPDVTACLPKSSCPGSVLPLNMV